MAESNTLNFSGANRPEEDPGTGTQALPETSALFLTELPVLSVRPAVIWTRDYPPVLSHYHAVVGKVTVTPLLSNVTIFFL